jgi:hypothetical protein
MPERTGIEMKKLFAIPAVAVVALAGCGEKTLNADDIESDVEGEYSARGFDVEGAECPDDIEAKAGTTGECSLTANGVTVPVEIRPTDEEGAYDFEIVPSEAKKLEQAATGNP